MQIIQLPRGGGKTKRLIDLALANQPAVIVAATEDEASRVRNLIRTWVGPDGLILNARVDVLSAETCARQGGLGPKGKVYVDNADWVLELLLRRTIEAATFTDKGPE